MRKEYLKRGNPLGKMVVYKFEDIVAETLFEVKNYTLDC